jgi:hypothetical protein
MRGAKFGLMVMIVASLLGREVCGRCAVERGIHSLQYLLYVQYSVCSRYVPDRRSLSLVPGSAGAGEGS